MISNARALFKLLLFMFLSLFLAPLQCALLFFRVKNLYSVPMLWHKGVCKIFSIETEIVGEPLTDGQTVFVSNHLSYLDIPVISSFLKASFIAKKEVERWPLFGFLSKLQQTVFIDRRPGKAREGSEQLSDMISENKNVVLFPEGTSSDGSAILPFKSSIFSVIVNLRESGNVSLQPFTILHKNPDRLHGAGLYAWHGDMELPPHLWAFAKSGGAKIKLVFHPPVKLEQSADRKQLAKLCEEMVACGLANEKPFQDMLDTDACNVRVTA